MKQIRFTLQIPLHEHGGGQLCAGNFRIIEDRVPHIGHIVGGDDTRVSRAVTGEGKDGKFRAGEGEGGISGADQHIGGEALLGEEFAGFAIGKADVIGAVGLGVGGDARLDNVGGDGDAVALLQIADVAAVVEVGVGADDAPQRHHFIKELGEPFAVRFGKARVDNDGLVLLDHV